MQPLSLQIDGTTLPINLTAFRLPLWVTAVRNAIPWLHPLQFQGQPALCHSIDFGLLTRFYDGTGCDE
jgi:hypothetical protein